MLARVYSRSLSVVRWSRDRVQNQMRRLRKPRLSSLVIYVLLIFLLFMGSLSSLPSLTSKPSSNGISDEGKNDNSQVHVIHKERVRRSPPPLVNPHNFHLMISNPRLCADVDEVQLLILVASSARNVDHRQAIRSTWGQNDYLLSFKTRLLFLLANPNDSKIQQKIVEEYRSYGDTVQEDFAESYLNLTLKTIMGIKWALNYCSKATFVMKTDDDIFVNVPLLIYYLNNLQRETFFAGCIKQRNAFKPVNADPSSILPPAHPLFAAGAGYVFSGSLLQSLFDASVRTKILPVEDVYITGHLAKIVNAHPPIHDNRFSCGEMVMKDCHMTKLFTGHRITPGRMHSLWNILNPNNVRNFCD